MKKALEEKCVKQHIDMPKQTINTWRIYDRNIESSFLEYVDANNLYGWAMWQKLPIGNFKWIEKDDISKFDEKFIKNYDENSFLFFLLLSSLFIVDLNYYILS